MRMARLAVGFARRHSPGPPSRVRAVCSTGPLAAARATEWCFELLPRRGARSWASAPRSEAGGRMYTHHGLARRLARARPGNLLPLATGPAGRRNPTLRPHRSPLQLRPTHAQALAGTAARRAFHGHPTAGMLVGRARAIADSQRRPCQWQKGVCGFTRVMATDLFLGVCPLAGVLASGAILGDMGSAIDATHVPAARYLVAERNEAAEFCLREDAFFLLGGSRPCTPGRQQDRQVGGQLSCASARAVQHIIGCCHLCY